MPMAFELRAFFDMTMPANRQRVGQLDRAFRCKTTQSLLLLVERHVTTRLGTAVRSPGDEAQIDVDHRQIGSRADDGDAVARAAVGREQIPKEVVEFEIRQGRIMNKTLCRVRREASVGRAAAVALGIKSG